MRKIVMLIVTLALATTLYAADAVPLPIPIVKPYPRPLLYTYNNYLYSMVGNATPESAAACLAAQKVNPPPEFIQIGGGWHGSIKEYNDKQLWKWILGEAKFDDPQCGLSWAKGFEGRKPNMVMVQAEGLTDMKPFRDAAVKVNSRFLVYVTPGLTSATMRRLGKREQPPEGVTPVNGLVPKTLQECEKEAQTYDNTYAIIAKELDAEIVPTYRTFLILRKKYPELNLHVGRDAWDGHMSPFDSYVTGCTLATAILRQPLTELPDPEVILKDAYAKYTNLPKIRELLTPEIQKAIHEAAWEAIQIQMKTESPAVKLANTTSQFCIGPVVGGMPYDDPTITAKIRALTTATELMPYLDKPSAMERYEAVIALGKLKNNATDAIAKRKYSVNPTPKLTSNQT